MRGLTLVDWMERKPLSLDCSIVRVSAIGCCCCSPNDYKGHLAEPSAFAAALAQGAP